MDRQLSRDEDVELRRLAALASFGRLTGPTAVLLEELRAHDRRATIREPLDVVAAAQPQADEAAADHEAPHDNADHDAAKQDVSD